VLKRRLSRSLGVKLGCRREGTKRDSVVALGQSAAMAGLSACTRELKELEVSDCRPMDGSTEPEFHTALTWEGEHVTSSSSSSFFSASCENAVVTMESGERTQIAEREERVRHSQVHWSQVSEASLDLDEERAGEMDNREVFKSLQLHPTWGKFFITFGYHLGIGRRNSGELKVGEKFAEGGQAELFHAHITWAHPKYNEKDLEDGTEWVIKVFKKGTLLRHLQSQWPQGYLEWWAKNLECQKLGIPGERRHQCCVAYGTLLEDGRFGFLMVKEDEDLRSVIDRNMITNVGKSHGPFEKKSEDAEMLMYRIALGMDWLHSLNIVHRDLKASNVLMRKDGNWASFVADFECSIGVVGTGFWRAPEILQACKDKNVFKSPEIFTKQADIYSYGMTCYEILTGKLPFEGRSMRDYDIVLNGGRPQLPEYIDDWARRLLNWCWQPNAANRPSFGDILKFLSANSRFLKKD
jgi:serine/threonine protein kinase